MGVARLSVTFSRLTLAAKEGLGGFGAVEFAQALLALPKGSMIVDVQAIYTGRDFQDIEAKGLQISHPSFRDGGEIVVTFQRHVYIDEQGHMGEFTEFKGLNLSDATRKP